MLLLGYLDERACKPAAKRGHAAIEPERDAF
jgi:hypothetical protein